MKNFSMPADFRPQTIDGYAELNTKYADSKVVETYGNVTADNIFASGRSVDNLPQVTLGDLASYVRYSQEREVDFCYTVNASYMGNMEFTKEGILEIRKFLDALRDAGVGCLVIAMPSLIELVRSMGYEFRIKTSVIGQVTSVNKAMAFKGMGVDKITVDESVNREFHTLKRIRDAFGEEVEIIVNSVCHQDCHYRMFHYNQISGDSVQVASEASCRYFPTRCVLRLYEDLGNYFKATWIRPEDMHYYTAIGLSYFKLQGRQSVLQGDPVRTAECYFKERFDGDLKYLLYLFAPPSALRVSVDNRSLDGFLKPFVHDPEFCKRDCTTCSYCDAFADRLLDDEEARQIAESSLETLSSNDPFRKMINNSSGNA